jgi:hypothetical protein
LAEDHSDTNVARGKLVEAGSQLTELPATVRSPHPAVKDEQQSTFPPKQIA